MLREAPGDDQLPPGGLLLELGHLEDRVDRLLLRPVDEGAGVDDQHVGPRGLAGDLMPRRLGEAEHDLRIDEVLGAAERHDTDLHAGLTQG